MATASDVDRWFAKYENPKRDVVARVREIILGADKRIGECIKWQAPTFTYRGNLASFFPKSKEHASLMFHSGAEIPGTHPRLEGTSNKGRVLKLSTVAEANKAKKEIEKIVRAWCDWRDETMGASARAIRAPRVAKSRSRNPAAKKISRRTQAERARTK